MFKRITAIVVLVPVAVVLVALAVANRRPVAFTLDPFDPGSAGLTATMPLFIYLFAALAIGIVIGSFATWVRQRSYRRIARQRGAEAERAPKGRVPGSPAPPRRTN